MNESFKTAEDAAKHASAGKGERVSKHEGVRRPRDALPDIEERARRMGDLIAAPALPLADVSLFLDCPLSTMDMLRAQGKGPRTFKLGRRLYVRQVDLRDWLDRMATEAAA